MFENRVFDIFVYRLSPEQRSAERKRLRSASTDPTIIYGGMGKEKGEAFWANLTEEEQREIKRHWEYMFDNSTEARGWLYNDVIGYVAGIP